MISQAEWLKSFEMGKIAIQNTVIFIVLKEQWLDKWYEWVESL